MKPKAAIVSAKRTAFLMKESATPKVLEPLSPEEQQKLLPPGTKNPAGHLDESAMDISIHHLKGLKDGRKYLDEASQEDLHDACLTLLDVPSAFAKALSIAKFVLLALLSLVVDLALPYLPGVPIVYLGILVGVPELSRMLLRAISGPDIQCRKKWEVKRPSTLLPFVPLGETAPALVPEAYLGGWLKDWRGRKIHFWLPYYCQAVAIASNVPHKVAEKIIGASPLAVYFVLGMDKFQNKGRPSLDIDGSAFLSFDPLMMDRLGRLEKVVYAEVQDFIRWLRAKEKRWEAWLSDIDLFLPKSAQGRFVQINSDPDALLYACRLALLKSFLNFAVNKRGWLTDNEAQQFLLNYWRLVLPESAPVNSAGDGVRAGRYRWNDPLTFWTFLSDYIGKYAAEISTGGAPVMREIVGVLHRLPDGAYLIFPRSPVFQAYKTWLHDQRPDVPEQGGRWETQMQTAIMDWGIHVKSEGKDISWRFAFYRKGQAPDTLKEKLPCLAFPLVQLPPEIIAALDSALGSSFAPWNPNVESEVITDA